MSHLSNGPDVILGQPGSRMVLASLIREHSPALLVTIPIVVCDGA